MVSDRQELLKGLLPFVGKGYGSESSITPLCSTATCGYMGRLSVNKHAARSDAAKVGACNKLIDKGWGFDGLPICPKCQKSHL